MIDTFRSRPDPSNFARRALRRTCQLAAVAGRPTSARAVRGLGGLEQFEGRVLLSGDHDGLPMPWNPAAGTVIALDTASADTAAQRGRNTSTVNGTIAAGDSGDMFKFTVPATGSRTRDFVTVLADTTSVGSLLDTFVEIYNASGTLIATGSTNGNLSVGLNSLLPVAQRSPDGWVGFEGDVGATYYIRVRAESTPLPGRGSTGNYRVFVDASTVSTTVNTVDGPDLQTPNADFGLVFAEDTLTARQQDIVYRVVTPNTARFDSLATFQAIADNNTLLNPHIDVYSTGNAQGVVSRLAGDTDAGRQTDSFTTYKTARNTVYYIRVRSDDLRAAPTGQSTGVYQMQARFSAQAIPIDTVIRQGATGEMVTANDDPTTPWSNIPLRGPGNRTGTDSRLFQFTAQGTGLGIITALAQTATRPIADQVDALPQPAIRVFDSSGVSLDFNKGDGLAQLLLPVVGNTTYYIVLEGFDNVQDGGAQIFLEAHHTFDPTQPVDDHINTPQNGNPLLWRDATPIVFGDPFQLADAEGNALRDRTWLQNGVGRGRVHTAGDTDLFQFVAPQNQLSAYAGDDGNQGSGLYVGGNFLSAGTDPRTGLPYDSANVGIFDGGSWFNAGAATEADGALNGPVFAMTSWDPDGAAGALAPVLAVGGRFTSVFNPLLGDIPLGNLAFRVFSTDLGAYVWSADPFSATNDNPLRTNGPVFALAAGDVRPAALQGGTEAPELYVGGQFTQLNGANPVGNGFGLFVNAGGLAFNNLNATGGATPGIFAMTLWDPPQPPAFQGPVAPATGQPPDQPKDYPLSLFFGGRFLNAGGVNNVNNIARFGTNGESDAALAAMQTTGLNNRFNPITFGAMGPGTATPVEFGVNGPVFALGVWNDPGEIPPAAMGQTTLAIPERLIVGGQFTSGGGGTVASTNIIAYDYTAVVDVATAQIPRRWVSLGGGVPGVVRSITSWRTPDIDGNGTISTNGNSVPVLVAGGDGDTVGTGAVRILQSAAPGGAWATFSTTDDGTVRSVVAFQDDEIGFAPGVNADGTRARFETLHIAGDFTQIDGADGFNHIARLNLDLTGPGFFWQNMGSGTEGVSPGEAGGTVSGVNVLFFFDDNVAGVWDRNERAASQVQIRLNATSESQIDGFITVYDSNFNIVWTNDTLDPLGQADVAGSNDPSIAPLFQDQNIPAWVNASRPFGSFSTWAGEVYYIEVSSVGGTGRYTLDVTTDALPPNPDPSDTSGVFIDDFSAFQQPPGAGQFADAPEIRLDNAGKGGTFRDPLNANNPSSYTARGFRTTPGGIQRTEFIDPPVIARVGDTNLYQFRAPNDGTVEIRIATQNITRAYQEQFFNVATNTTTSRTLTKTLSSPFHGAIRAFNNDFVQLGYSNNNFAVSGFSETFFIRQPDGNINPPEQGFRTFTHDDPRLVINVRRGNTYFIQVESAFKGTAATDPDLVDWRFATGAYDLQLSATPSLNGIDDHANAFQGPNGLVPSGVDHTAIPIDNVTGASTFNGVPGPISGEIRNVTNPPFINNPDSDVFRMIAVNRGQITVTLTPTDPLLQPQLRVVDANLNVITTAAGGPNQAVTVNFPTEQGEQFYFIVTGGGSQGRYTINVASPGITDDQPFSNAVPNDITDPIAGWANPRVLELNRYLGVYGEPTGPSGAITAVSGNIENPGDEDLFRFTAESYELATVTVTKIDPTLDPFVQVWEVSTDGAGRRVYLKIALNGDVSGSDTNSLARFSVTPGRDYYIQVSGTNFNTDFGRYSVGVNVTPTDDHPNRTDFPLATAIGLVADPINFTATGSSSGVIQPTGDDDLFRFTAPASGTADVTLARSGASLLALNLRVLDSNNMTLPGVTFTVTTTSIIAHLPSVVQSQQYYLLVGAAAIVPPGSEETGAYTIQVDIAPVDDYPNEGDFANAHNIPLSSLTGVGTLNGLIVPTGDSDIFKFTTLAAGNVTVRASTPGSTLNPRLVIFRSDQTQAFSANGNGDSAAITFNATGAGQVFYVVVKAADTASGVSAVGSYTLTINASTGTGPGPGPGTDDFPNAGEWNDAAQIGLDTVTGDGGITGIINYSGDTDLFKFTTAASGRVDIQLTTPLGGLVDGQIKIYNSAMTLVFQDAAGIPGATAAVNFNAGSGQTFFLLIEPVGAATGSYTVRIDSQPLTHFLYYPEGFAGATIDEFVPLVNTNAFPVNVSIFARYETGANPNTPIYTGVLPANSRSGVTISTRNNQAGSLVRIGEPYSLEIQSSAQIGATFSHYDFGASIGESFSNRTSTAWTFAEAHRDDSTYRDFLLFYNPGAAPTNVNITLFYTDGTTTTFSQVLDGLRRSGINFSTDGRVVKNGTFGIRIDSASPIVASVTSYNLPRSGGDGVLGDADAGSVRGVVTNISNGAGVVSSFAVLNTNSLPATVTIVANYARSDLPNVTRVLTVQPGSTLPVDLNTFGLIPGQTFGLSYTSNSPVTFTATEYQFSDGNATLTASFAAREFLFGDLFVNPAQAGIKYFEQLGLFNPSGTAIDVSIRFLFTNGTSASIVQHVNANTFAFVRIDQQAAILGLGSPTAFSMQVTSATPIVASLTHYDLVLDGGWSALGAPIGLTNPLSSIV